MSSSSSAQMPSLEKCLANTQTAFKGAQSTFQDVLDVASHIDTFFSEIKNEIKELRQEMDRKFSDKNLDEDDANLGEDEIIDENTGQTWRELKEAIRNGEVVVRAKEKRKNVKQKSAKKARKVKPTNVPSANVEDSSSGQSSESFDPTPAIEFMDALNAANSADAKKARIAEKAHFMKYYETLKKTLEEDAANSSSSSSREKAVAGAAILGTIRPKNIKKYSLKKRLQKAKPSTASDGEVTTRKTPAKKTKKTKRTNVTPSLKVLTQPPSSDDGSEPQNISSQESSQESSQDEKECPTKDCPQCGEKIHCACRKCPHCGQSALRQDKRSIRERKRRQEKAREPAVKKLKFNHGASGQGESV